jgi:spermidine/putrescine transport system substrate-binding protein
VRLALVYPPERDLMHPREGGRKVFGQRLSRRDFLRGSAITAASIPTASALLAACGGRPESGGTDTAALTDPARRDNPITYDINEHNGDLLIESGLKNEGGPLEIFNWEEYINPTEVKRFEDAFGVQVNITTFTSMVDAVTRLTTREQSYDVIMGLTPDFVGRLILLDLLRPLQHSYIPNLEANIWPSFSAPDQPFYDVGSHYTVPYTIYTTGVGYRVDKGPTDHITMDLSYLEEAVPAMDNPYDLLWDPKFKGYSHMLDDYRSSPGLAMLRRDPNADLNTGDPAVINQARDDLVEAIQTVGTKFDVNDYVDMPEGTAYVHAAWSGDLASVVYYYPSWSPRDMIRYWYPEDGAGMIGNDTIALLANGKNPVLSHTFLNYMLDFAAGMRNFKWNGYIPPQKKITSPSMVVKGSPDAIAEFAIIAPGMVNCIPKESDFIRGSENLELTSEVDKLWKDAWEVVQTT